MQSRGQGPAPSKPEGSVPATDDEIREKYLERAIRELNQRKGSTPLSDALSSLLQ